MAFGSKNRWPCVVQIESMSINCRVVFIGILACAALLNAGQSLKASRSKNSLLIWKFRIDQHQHDENILPLEGDQFGKLASIFSPIPRPMALFAGSSDSSPSQKRFADENERSIAGASSYGHLLKSNRTVLISNGRNSSARVFPWNAIGATCRSSRSTKLADWMGKHVEIFAALVMPCAS